MTGCGTPSQLSWRRQLVQPLHHAATLLPCSPPTLQPGHATPPLGFSYPFARHNSHMQGRTHPASRVPWLKQCCLRSAR
jgi:hypothetical protein